MILVEVFIWTIEMRRRTGIILAVVGLVVVLPLVSAISPDFSDEAFLYSSAVSPDGVWVAENLGTDGCCNGGFVLIRKRSEPSRSSNAVIHLPSPEPSLFMIWQDEKNLSLFRDANDAPISGPSKYRGIGIVYAVYKNRTNDRHTFDVANYPKKSLVLKERDVSAKATEEQTASGRNCALALSARDGAVFDEIGMRVKASINRCYKSSNCAGISSNFWVGERIDRQPGVALTSATVSDIPSYNRLPAGDHMSLARGSFGEKSAIDLMAALSSEAIDIQYSLNFFDTVVSYRVATKGIADAIGSFRACVGDADFNWLTREKP